MAERFPKEFLVARFSKKFRLVQIVLKLKDVRGAMASVNSITAGEGADIRQSVAYAVATEKAVIYDTFVTIPQGYDVSNLVKKLKASPFVLDVVGKEGYEGAIVDTLTFPINFTGQRAVLLQTKPLIEMFDAVQSVFGSGGSAIMYQQGKNYGKALAGEFAKTLTKPYMVRNVEYGLGLLQAMGWGIPTVMKKSGDLGEVTVRLQECFECEGRGKGTPVGFFTGGFMAGIFSYLSDTDVNAVEVACLSAGQGYCEFVLTRASGKGRG